MILANENIALIKVFKEFFLNFRENFSLMT